MSKVNKNAVNTTPYVKLDAIKMSESQREEAISALRLGEATASAILWLYGGVKQLANAKPKHSFRHNVAA